MIRLLQVVFGFALFSCLAEIGSTQDEQFTKAQSRRNDLRYEVYATAQQVEELATQQAVRERAWQAIQQLGITKVIVEVYRGGHVVSATHLRQVRDWLQTKGIEVVGGIATVPGANFGVRQEGPLGWFNWQNQKTQRDLEQVVRTAAEIFDTFIVDDFLCTGDVSEESKKAKGNRDWGTYRRELISEVAQSVFIRPAKEVNPSITMIVKYPQWYDRFHQFGYDTVTLPQVFDQVWVGTETRGRTTRRFGFVQPYEGFVNYRWLAGIAPLKIRGAWFDHGDCGEFDFLDQAYMSVLAGAHELVFFNLGDVISGHPDHQKVVGQYGQLADLAATVQTQPAQGIAVYKPPNSDPAGDMYLMDFLGMLGIPIVPVHEFPNSDSVIVLPAQAAADPRLLSKVREARENGVRLIVTASLLSVRSIAEELAEVLRVPSDIHSNPFSAKWINPSQGSEVKNEVTEVELTLESPLEVESSVANIVCTAGHRQHALLATFDSTKGSTVVLNTHTFSQEDFDEVGEVLLSPRPLGLIELEGEPLQKLRKAFSDQDTAILEGPNCVTLHQLVGGNSTDYVLQNFNERPVKVKLLVPSNSENQTQYKDRLSGDRHVTLESLKGGYSNLVIEIPARGRVWLQPSE